MSLKLNSIKLLVTGIVFFTVIHVLFSCEKQGQKQQPVSKPFTLTVLFSSDLLGKIRSCGCAVKEMGGLGRRATYIEDMRNSLSHVIVVDAGDAFSLDLSYSKTEAELTFDVFNLMGLDAFTPGEIDFVFGVSFLKDLAGKSIFRIIAANIVDAETGEPIFGPPYTVKEFENGYRVGIIGVIDDTTRFPGYVDTSSFKILPVKQTLRRILPSLTEKADLLILLSHLGLEKSYELAREVPGFDLIVVGHGKPITKRLEKVGETLVIATGGEGQYMGRINLSILKSGEYSAAKVDLVPLVKELEIHPGVEALFARYGVELTDKERNKKK